MNNRATLEEITNAYNLGRAEMEAEAYEHGRADERKRRSNKVMALGWICLIELGFIILILH